MSSKLIGVPVDKLTFVRVLAGLDGFSADQDGSISTSLSSSSLDGGRMTTHGSLNGVVSDHIYGTFSQSRFAVVGNLMEMADKNELASIQPADTFFWSKDGKLNIPNAVLFAPDGEELPKALQDAVNVIRYDANAGDETPFHNLRHAIHQELHKNDIPAYGISMNGWIRNTWVDNHPDNTKAIAAELSEKLGYKVLNDLHANTPYAQAENSIRYLQGFSQECDQLNTVDDYISHKAHSIQQGGVSLIQNTEGSLNSLNQALSLMPDNRKEVYSAHYGDESNAVYQKLNDKLDIWFPEEPEVVFTTPPPIPMSPPPIPMVPPPLPTEPSLKQAFGADLSQLPEPQSHASKFIDDYLRGVASKEVPVELLQEKDTISDLRLDAEKSIRELSTLLTSKGLLWKFNLEDLGANDSGVTQRYFANAMQDELVARVYDRSKNEMELFSEALTCHAADVGDYLGQSASQDGIRSDVNELSPFKDQLKNSFNLDLEFIEKHAVLSADTTHQVNRTVASAEPGLIPRTQHQEASFVM